MSDSLMKGQNQFHCMRETLSGRVTSKLTPRINGVATRTSEKIEWKWATLSDDETRIEKGKEIEKKVAFSINFANLTVKCVLYL